MEYSSQRSIQAALSGERRAVSSLVDALSPVIQARVARALMRNGAAVRRGSVRQAVEDLVQDCFRILFADDARVLRAWDPERGLNLKGYVAMVSEREAISVLRSRRRNPFTEDPVEAEQLDRGMSTESQPQAETEFMNRDLTRRVYAGLQQSLSPKGLLVFRALFVDELSTEAACDQLDLSADALYAWRSRIRKTARALASQLQEEAAS